MMQGIFWATAISIARVIFSPAAAAHRPAAKTEIHHGDATP